MKEIKSINYKILDGKPYIYLISVERLPLNKPVEGELLKPKPEGLVFRHEVIIP